MSTYHHGDLRAALLEAAGELLEEGGIDALSLREAARRAGVSHNAPYRHFPDRDALLEALASYGFDQMNEAAAKRPEGHMGMGYVEFALAHPQRFRLMFGGRFPQLRTQAEQSLERMKATFQGLGPDALYAAAAGWALVHGLASLMLDG